jgi:multiple sugar transport system permease protein
MYANYGLLGSIRTFIYPAILGQGFNGAIFILIFYSFFKMIPKSLEESAQLDGASPFKVFTKIAIPLAIPAIIIVFLFSFVWYYNETFLSGLYLRGSSVLTLPLRVEQFFINYTALFPEGTQARELMQAAKLAGNILTILPLLILYFFTQKHFVESIDRTGITGE